MMRITLKKKVGIAIAVAALTLGMAGCGAQKSASEQQKDAAAAASSEAAALPGTAWVRAEADQVKQGGTLTEAISQLPSNWNYGQADGTLYDLGKMKDPMGNFLVSDEKGDVSLNPDYIESAEITSTNPQVVTVKYNKNVKWEDGTPITIADLISDWKAQNGSNPAFLVASSDGWDQITSIKQTTDAYTGEITFKSSFADWQPYIFPDIPTSISSDPTVFNTGYVSKNTPSYGPFKIKSIDAKAGVVTMVPNENWWGAKPKLDSIVFKVLSTEQTPQSFANGEIDTLEVTSPDEYQTAKSRKDAQIQTTNGLTWSHLTIQAAKGPLADPAVRKAFAYAINRDAIAESAVGGLGAPVVLQNNVIFMPGQEGYEDSFGGELKYDPDQAKKILTDAGYTQGSDGVWAKGDTKLEGLTITVPAGTASNATRAQQIMKNLSDIGVKVELQTVPSDAYFRDYVLKKNFQMATFSWVGTLFPMQSAGNIFTDSAQNYTGVVNKDVPSLNEQMLTETDHAKRLQIANELSKAALSDYTVIPFYSTPNVWAVKSGLVNLGASMLETVDWTKVGWSAQS